MVSNYNYLAGTIQLDASLRLVDRGPATRLFLPARRGLAVAAELDNTLAEFRGNSPSNGPAIADRRGSWADVWACWDRATQNVRLHPCRCGDEREGHRDLVLTLDSR
jgi:hypothetical protein